MSSLGNASFDSETLVLLRAALDEAWSSLKPEQQARTSKSALARALLYFAAQGERNPVRLRTHALSAVAILRDVLTLLESQQPTDVYVGHLSMFTFEIDRDGKAPIVADVLRLPDEQAIWCFLDALALRIQDEDGAFIQVRNADGEIVVRIGVRTALASIEKRSCRAVSRLDITQLDKA
jgi:hypothetical protein